MFYAWTPGVYVRARLLENSFKGVERNLVRAVTNSVDVLCLTLCTETGYVRTGFGVPLEIRPHKASQLVCAMFGVEPVEILACRVCRYTGP